MYSNTDPKWLKHQVKPSSKHHFKIGWTYYGLTHKSLNKQISKLNSWPKFETSPPPILKRLTCKTNGSYEEFVLPWELLKEPYSKSFNFKGIRKIFFENSLQNFDGILSLSSDII